MVTDELNDGQKFNDYVYCKINYEISNFKKVDFLCYILLSILDLQQWFYRTPAKSIILFLSSLVACS